MKNLQIRFLKPGLIEVPSVHVPQEIMNMTSEEQAAWADLYLSHLTDEQITEAMADFADRKDGFFDTTTVEAIQDPEKFDTADESIYSTTAWDAFIDPEFGENIIYKNDQMDKFLSLMGFSQDNITSITNGSFDQVMGSSGLSDSYMHSIEREVDNILCGTPYSACIIETSELYESDKENDPFEGMPMYEAFIEDDQEIQVSETTGRYCELSSVREELLKFAVEIAKDYENGVLP